MLKFAKRNLTFITGGVIIVLLLIHFVLKESTYFLSLLYYTFPLPLITIIVGLFSFLHKRTTKVLYLLLTTILLVIWLSRSYRINSFEPIVDTDTEIVFWNAAHHREFIDVFKKVKTVPDIVVLVEYHANAITETKLEYPEYYFFWHEESEIGIFSKTPITIKNIMVSNDETTVIHFETRNLNLYAVDISSSMYLYRKHQLEFVSNTIAINSNSIILGDFNLPFESVFFKDIKQNFNHVLSEKGNGFRETWFFNIPLLSLDHIWVSKDLQIINAEKLNTFKSDHSMIKTVIRR